MANSYVAELLAYNKSDSVEKFFPISKWILLSNVGGLKGSIQASNNSGLCLVRPGCRLCNNPEDPTDWGAPLAVGDAEVDSADDISFGSGYWPIGNPPTPDLLEFRYIMLGVIALNSTNSGALEMCQARVFFDIRPG